MYMLAAGLLCGAAVITTGCAGVKIPPIPVGCEQLRLLEATLCPADMPASAECLAAREAAKACPAPAPPPPVVVVPPVITPPPVVPPPVVSPPVASCPAKCPADAQTMNARCLQKNRDGKCITDSTPRCGDRGDDQGYCGKVTNNPAIHACKAQPEGSGLTGCDDAFIGAPCPIWQWSTNGSDWSRCLPDGIGPQGQPFSCDHFQGWTDSDGLPYTGRCEKSLEGLHAPISGFSTVPHGKGWARACNADASVCSDPLAVDY
jgi:hypothetical protein